jgi:hypothetical protein
VAVGDLTSEREKTLPTCDGMDRTNGLNLGHKRELGPSYCEENGEFIALIFYWKEPDGTERRS